MNKLVSASLLAADKNNLINELKRLEINNVDLVHFDVMDNVFVPNTSFNDDTFVKIRNYSKLFFEIHLMVQDPFKYIDNYNFCENDVIIVHYESFDTEDKLLECLYKIKKHHRVGLSIKPKTPVEVLDKYLNILDYILIMSVEPGFGGQKFIDSALDKISYLANKKGNYDYFIEVDGGINNETSEKCWDAGVDILVSGSYLFKENMKERVEVIKCEK